jgi:hypothetical protein
MIKETVAGAMTDVRDPVSFKMYTFNDQASYGALEVLRNLMTDFDEAFSAKDWHEMWVVIEALPMFLLFGAGGAISMCDDGEMVKKSIDVLSRAPLAATAALESHASAKGENAWQPRNIGWIITMWMDLSERFREDSLMESPKASQAKNFKWTSRNLDFYLVATAKRRGITVVDVPKSMIEATPATTMPNLDKDDPWGWSAAFKTLKSRGAITFKGKKDAFAGDALDITTWFAGERKEAAYEQGRDPITPSMMKKIKEGMVMMRG